MGPTSISGNTNVNATTSPEIMPANYRSMTPEAIMEYVEATLQNIDGQLSDFQADAMAKNKLANAWRACKQLVRENTGKDGTQFPTTQPALGQAIAHIHETFDPMIVSATTPDLKRALTELMNKLLPNGQLPQLSKVDRSLYENATAADAAESDARVDYEHEMQDWYPKNISKEEGDRVTQQADDALQTLNSDNELVMMRLQTLMQQRQHVTSSATNQMESHNQCVNGILQNMR